MNHIPQEDARMLLDEEFPPVVRGRFIPVFRKAFALANSLYDENPCLRWRVGEDLFRAVRRVAVQYAIIDSIERNKLPLDYRIVQNAAGNCYHIELLTNRLLLTVEQVRNRHDLPRRAVYRKEYSLQNGSFVYQQATFWGELLERTPPYYAILTYGHRIDLKPDFISLGIPQPGLERWIAILDLLGVAHEIDIPEIERIEEQDLLRFKEHLREMRIDEA